MAVRKWHLEIKNEKDKTKEALIYVVFNWGERYKISIGKKILPELWNKKTKEAYISNDMPQLQQRHLKRLNKYINQVKEIVAENFEQLKYWNDSLGYEARNIIREKINKIGQEEVKEEKKKNISVLDFVQKVIDDMPNKLVKRTGKFIDERTVGHHKIIKKRLEKFFAFKKWGDGTFDLFNKKFENEMEKWMLQTEEYTPNTVCATFSVMKVWLNQAEEEGLIKDGSFHSWKSKGYDVEHIYLNEEELEKIYKVDFSEYQRKHPNTTIEQTRDLFIVASKVGLRISDLNSLNSSNWDMDNKTVQVHTKKTTKTVLVPLSKEVVAIYKKYQGKFPKAIDKTHFNNHLRKIGEMAKINQTIFVKSNSGGKIEIEEKKKYELISSHTARRSFATNLYIKSKNARMVMEFTGHTTEENFRKYICWDKEEVVEMAREFFD